MQADNSKICVHVGFNKVLTTVFFSTMRRTGLAITAVLCTTGKWNFNLKYFKDVCNIPRHARCMVHWWIYLGRQRACSWVQLGGTRFTAHMKAETMHSIENFNYKKKEMFLPAVVCYQGYRSLRRMIGAGRKKREARKTTCKHLGDDLREATPAPEPLKSCLKTPDSVPRNLRVRFEGVKSAWVPPSVRRKREEQSRLAKEKWQGPNSPSPDAIIIAGDVLPSDSSKENLVVDIQGTTEPEGIRAVVTQSPSDILSQVETLERTDSILSAVSIEPLIVSMDPKEGILDVFSAAASHSCQMTKPGSEPTALCAPCSCKDLAKSAHAACRGSPHDSEATSKLDCSTYVDTVPSDVKGQGEQAVGLKQERLTSKDLLGASGVPPASLSPVVISSESQIKKCEKTETAQSSKAGPQQEDAPTLKTKFRLRITKDKADIFPKDGDAALVTAKKSDDVTGKNNVAIDSDVPSAFPCPIVVSSEDQIKTCEKIKTTEQSSKAGPRLKTKFPLRICREITKPANPPTVASGIVKSRRATWEEKGKWPADAWREKDPSLLTEAEKKMRDEEIAEEAAERSYEARAVAYWKSKAPVYPNNPAGTSKSHGMQKVSVVPPTGASEPLGDFPSLQSVHFVNKYSGTVASELVASQEQVEEQRKRWAELTGKQ